MVAENQKHGPTLEDIYTDPEISITWNPSPLAHVKDDCLVILDTSVLLLPYDVMHNSFQEIKSVLSRLKTEGRLRIDKQSIREFLSTRPTKVNEIVSNISQRKSQTKRLEALNIPLLDDVNSYAMATSVAAEINLKIAEYQRLLNEVLEQVRTWHWSDPLSAFYRDLISGDIVVDSLFEGDRLRDEAERRKRLNLPPGYKDAGKATNAYGDLIVWGAILRLAQQEQRHCLFVTNDLKLDWWHRANNEPIYARFELVDEYRRHSKGKTLHLVTLSRLLELIGVRKDVVEDVRQQELLSPEPLDFILVHKDWSVVLELVAKIDRRIEALLKNAEPVSVSGRQVILYAEYEFHQQRLSNSTEKDVVRSVMEKLWGKPVELEIDGPGSQVASTMDDEVPI